MKRIIKNNFSVLFLDLNFSDELKKDLESIIDFAIYEQQESRYLQLLKDESFDLLITSSKTIKKYSSHLISKKYKVVSIYKEEQDLKELFGTNIFGVIKEPIEKEITNSIKDLKNFVETERIRKQQDIFEVKRVMMEVVELLPNPTIILDQNFIIKYANDSFAHLVKKEFADELMDKECTLDKHLYKKDQNIQSIKDITQDYQQNIVAIKTDRGKKIFKVEVAKIVMENATLNKIYVFNDITELEYQKSILEKHKEDLEDLIIKKYKKKHSLLQEGTVLKDETRVISSKEEEALRRSYNHKICAKDYIVDIDHTLVEEIIEFEKYEINFFDKVENFITSPNETIEDMKKFFERYAGLISKLSEFEDISIALIGISHQLDSLYEEELEHKKVNKIALFTRAITEDLKIWRENIFVTQNVSDIHYLDSSFFSNCLQLEITIFGKEPVSTIDDDDGFDLF